MAGELEFRRVTFSYGPQPLLWELDLRLARGEMAALVGPNGSGKTTLLRLASGTLSPRVGGVYLDGVHLATLSARQIARRVAVVPQETRVPYAFTAWEMVMLGRTPYLDPIRGERAADRQAVERAMSLTRTLPFAQRCFSELSGGERQRVVLARALAQEPDLLLLDEPTANLDIAHQAAMLELVRDLNRQEGMTVLAAIHDLNLAALFFDRIIVIRQGRIVADGRPADVLQVPVIEGAFGGRVQVLEHPTHGGPLVVVVPDGTPRGGPARLPDGR